MVRIARSPGVAADGASASGSTPAVGFIGAGSMGGPMVERLLSAGVGVHLYARRPEVLDRFTALGAVAASSVAELAASADVLVVCPFSEAQLVEIADGGAGLLANARPGAVVVQHATVSTAAIRRLAAEGEGRKVTVLDAPISGRAEAVRAGRLTVLVGGDAVALARVEPLLRAYSSTIVHVGEVGEATAAKLVNNIAFAAHVQIAGAALRLGEQLGLSEAGLLEVLTSCSANSFALATVKSVGNAETFASLGARYLRKDVAVVEQAAAELGVDTGLLGATVRNGPFELVE